MAEFTDEMPLGVAVFDELIEAGAPYVDKTGFLAHIIKRMGKAWYLARPRRFGKTLTVSTLEQLFSGNRELFKGLAIEKHLNEKRFAPRPVLRLDMSVINTADGLPGFKKHLRHYTRVRAEKLGVELTSCLSGASVLQDLIEELGSKSPNGIAVLIDEYDAPLVKFLNRPDQIEDLRNTMRDYYQQLKGLERHITFLFATGVSRNSNLGLFSTVDHITDVSIESSYGAICGFTHEELESRFDPQLEESALSLRMTKGELLEEMRAYYDGFSFDGKTRVYNPYSALSFFADPDKYPDKAFSNYWFMSGTSYPLVKFMGDRHLTVEQFSGLTITLSSAKEPGPLDKIDAAGFLYQSGYLSLRSLPDEEDQGASIGSEAGGRYRPGLGSAEVGDKG